MKRTGVGVSPWNGGYKVVWPCGRSVLKASGVETGSVIAGVICRWVRLETVVQTPPPIRMQKNPSTKRTAMAINPNFPRSDFGAGLEAGLVFRTA